MATQVRSFSKINLGLTIGPPRADGFHELTTRYQTLALHDMVTVAAARSTETQLSLTSNHPWVPPDGRNTAWRMVESCLKRLGIAAVVKIRIQKNLPIQGGMGAGSANAAAALLALERELGLTLSRQERLELAAEIGSDVPLFLLGGTVLGTGRGEQVSPLPDLPETHCVIALPDVGVSTPQAFRDWDALHPVQSEDALTKSTVRGTLHELSPAVASTFAEPGTSGILCKPGLSIHSNSERLEKKRDDFDTNRSELQNDLAENALLALVRTGIENDFEQVVFSIHPSLRELKRYLMGNDLAGFGLVQNQASGADSSGSALYAGLSGSGSALFGLYRSIADAKAAQQRVQAAGCKAVTTHTLPRAAYWATMFAE